MSSPPAGTEPPAQPLPSTSSPVAATSTTKRTSGFRTALQYTGIPPSWFDKRPKLPSRNWLIFLSVSSSLLGLYAYDRKRCREIRNEYIQRVEHLAKLPLGSLELPRKVTVYASKWLGDEDYSRSVRYFKKYVKPIFVAAAVDYDILAGKRHGDLARAVADRIKTERRIDLGLEAPKLSLVPQPINETAEQAAARVLQGGSVIVGRMTFKEYMEGLRRGWSEPPEKVDREELIAHVLEEDGVFDLPEETNNFSSDVDGEPIPTKSRLMSSQNAQSFSPLKLPTSSPSSASSTATGLNPTAVSSPERIPPQAPLLLVPFTNFIGFRQIPLMIVDFFNQRSKVEAGAKAAYKLIMGETRPMSAPSPVSPDFQPAPEPLFSPDSTTKLAEPKATSDLDFDRLSESYYQSSVSKFLADIQKAREEYYNELPKRLATARALARGEREPTKDELSYPPPSEVELRAERLKKELRWRGDEEGWKIVRPEAEVAWDERFREALRVFVDQSDGADNGSASQ